MAKTKELKDKLKKHEKEFKSYRRTPEEKASIDFVEARRDQMKAARKASGVEKIWRSADIAYIPHEIENNKGKKVFASNDEEGLRSAQVTLFKDDAWQENSVPVNPYIKIQTALGIIVDRNPGAVMNPGAKKYAANTALIENLYQRNWETSHSRSACLKPFVFNCAKYGIGVGRTFPMTINRERRSGEKFVAFDDVFRESLSPWQAWFDESGKVGNPFSFNDCIYYKDYSWDKLKEQFEHLDHFKHIKPTPRVFDEESRNLKAYSEGEHKDDMPKIQERIWFYENLARDLYVVMTDDGVPLVVSEIPKTDENMMLSLWFAPWTYRNDVSINGIGIYEAMRNDHKLHTKIRGMTMDQLTASIYKEFFYEGTDMLTADGTMKMKPGVGRQVTNPQHIKWNEIPGPGVEAWKGIEYAEGKIDESSGVSKGLTGEVTGSTAYESAQARESALKRLKTPLENVTDALEQDAYLTISIMEDLYSVPTIKLIAEDRYIEATELAEMLEDEEFDVSNVEQEFREFPMSLEEDGEGNIVETDEEGFFTLKPEHVSWRGTIKIKGQSIIANSELLERVSTVEMSNLLIPLFQLPPQLMEKSAREIIKAYDKDPEDWLPELWMQKPEEENPLEKLFVDAGAGAEGDPTAEGGGEPVGAGANTLIPKSETNTPSSAFSNIRNSIKNS